MKFKNDIEIQAGVEAGGSTGSNGQVLSSTGSGVAWIDQNAISAGNAEHVVIYAKNTHTASIAKGTPVYITGTVGATDTVQIAPADASDSAKMPAVGLLNETLAVNAFGYVITGGFMDNITTDPIDGATPSSNDTVYVKAGGGLTLTKPTGPTGLIQNVAKVGKVSGGNSGSLIVSSILRTNDVPNLTTGKIWVGDGNTVESTVVHLDEANGRMGIGTPTPTTPLHIRANEPSIRLQDITSADNHYLTGNNGELRVQTSGYMTMRPGNAVSTTFLANGNVGIGTTSPSTKLHIVQPGGSSQLTLERTGGGAGKAVLAGAAEGLIVYDDVYGAKMYVGTSGTYNGNVGIGTTTPSQKLTVEGNIELGTGGYIYGDTTTSYLRLNNAVGSLLGYSNAYIGLGPSFVYNVGGSEKFRISSATGNVGIGTTSPGELLHLESTEPLIRLDDTNSGLHYVFGQDGDGFKFTTNNPTYGKYTFDTNVGIGTTSPGRAVNSKNKNSCLFPWYKNRRLQFFYGSLCSKH